MDDSDDKLSHLPSDLISPEELEAAYDVLGESLMTLEWERERQLNRAREAEQQTDQELRKTIQQHEERAGDLGQVIFRLDSAASDREILQTHIRDLETYLNELKKHHTMEKNELKQCLAECEKELMEIRSSLSWRMTQPFRVLQQAFNCRKGRG